MEARWPGIRQAKRVFTTGPSEYMTFLDDGAAENTADIVQVFRLHQLGDQDGQQCSRLHANRPTLGMEWQR